MSDTSDVPGSDVRQAIATVEMRPGLGLAQGEVQLGYGVDLGDAGPRIMAFYLHDFEVTRAYQSGGYASIAQYGEQRWDLDRRRTRELVRIGGRLRELPRIDEALCTRQIGWSKVVELCKVAVPEHEGAWLELALGMGCKELRTEVQLASAAGKPRDRGDRKGLSEVRFDVSCRVSATVREKLDLAREKICAERGELFGDAELLEVMADLLLRSEEDGSAPGRVRVRSSDYVIVLRPERDGSGADGGGLVLDGVQGEVPLDHVEQECAICDGRVVAMHDHEGAPDREALDRVARRGDMQEVRGWLSVEQATLLDRSTPAWLRARVLARDGHRCRCCKSKRQAQVHHIWHRGDEGPTQAFNLISLCKSCHSLTHAGLLQIQGKHERDVVFADAAGRPLQDSRRRVDRAQLVELKREYARRMLGEPGFAQGAGGRPARSSREGSLLTGSVLARGGLGSASLESDRLVSLDDIPDVIDSAWWARHERLIRMKAGRGLEFCEGHPTLSEVVRGHDLDISGPGELLTGLQAGSDGGLPASSKGVLSDGLSDGLSDRSSEGMSDGSSEALKEGASEGWNEEMPEAFVGCEELVARLRDEAAGCAELGVPFPHMLLSGPPGTGKTRLVVAVAEAYGRRLHRAMGTMIQDVPALLRLVTGLGQGDCLFIDEIHAVPRAVLETLYEVMQGGTLSLTFHSGNRSHCVSLVLPPLTVLAATTDPQVLPEPLQGRFGIVEQLLYYETEDLARILLDRAAEAGVELVPKAAHRMALCSRGTPREALRLMDSVFHQLAARRDEHARRGWLTAISRGSSKGNSKGTLKGSSTRAVRSMSEVLNRVTLRRVVQVLARMGYDEEGLSALDQRYLRVLREQSSPVSLHRLTRKLGCQEETLRDYVEPFLSGMGLVEFTSRGRVAQHRAHAQGPRLCRAQGLSVSEARITDERDSDARDSDARDSDARDSDARDSDARDSNARNCDAKNGEAGKSDSRERAKPPVSCSAELEERDLVGPGSGSLVGSGRTIRDDVDAGREALVGLATEPVLELDLLPGADRVSETAEDSGWGAREDWTWSRITRRSAVGGAPESGRTGRAVVEGLQGLAQPG